MFVVVFVAVVCVCVCVWGEGGKAVLGFGPGRIRTLVSMVTNSPHRVIIGKMLWPL